MAWTYDNQDWARVNNGVIELKMQMVRGLLQERRGSTQTTASVICRRKLPAVTPSRSAEATKFKE